MKRMALGIGLWLSLGATAWAASGCGAVMVQDSDLGGLHHVITVVGQGEVAARPDVARASIGVEASAPTVGAAVQQATARMNAVMTALKGVGIADKDLRTSNFSISEERVPNEYPQPMPMPEAAPPAPPPPPGPAGKATKSAAPMAAPAVAPMPMPYMQQNSYMPQPPMGMLPTHTVYRVSNTVEVKLRDLTKASAMLDAAVSAGANNVYGLNFEVDDPKPLEAQARDKAVADARARAESLAKQSGAPLGRVVHVSEIIGGGSGPMPMFSPMAMKSSGGPPIEAGEVHVSAQVQIDYAIGEQNDD